MYLTDKQLRGALRSIINREGNAEMIEAKGWDLKDFMNKVENRYNSVSSMPEIQDSFGSLEGQRALVETLVDDTYNDWTDAQIINHFSRGGGSQFFDVFMGEGEALKVSKILNEIGLTTKDLIGLKPFTDATQQRIPNTDLIINATWSSPDDGSPVLETFEIFNDGKIIYSYGDDEIKSFIIKNDDDVTYYVTKKGKTFAKDKSGRFVSIKTRR